MKYNCLLLIMICIIFICSIKLPAKTEQFRVINLPSFDKFIKYVRGYTCNKKTDSLPQWAVNKYNYKSFCNKYPTISALDRLSIVLISKATEINRRQIKVTNTNNLNVRHIPTNEIVLVKNNSIMRSAPINETKTLLKTEAMELLNREPRYKYIAVGKGKEMGKTIYYGGETSKIGPKIANIHHDLYEKINSVEYSISSWIKIDKLSSGWRNIFSIGNSSSIWAPSIWIKPNDTKIAIGIMTSKSSSWGEHVEFGNQNSIPLNKWCHIAITVSGRQIKCFIDGNLFVERNLRGYAKWQHNQKVYVANPWDNVGKYHLSKLKWYPISISKEFVENIKYLSGP